ncbi:myosin light chain 5-like protein [Lates japonicus]|uniref:Myosin light chain 5-like protein n=1 Tax=Lates japonicus TaxID=270547 RepID=A0AAD3R5Q9_LATJO|nr:myosin light chain 5-like protein [Lates japonicus]
MPSRCQSVSDGWVQETARAPPITGCGSTEQSGRSYPNFIPLFSDELHLLQAAGLWFFFVVIRCVVQTLCRITIIRRKRISYNMARRGGVWASRKTKKKEGGAKRAQRASSNVFSMFEQTQIQEFKEAFTLIDQNRDGFIDKEDLKDTYASLGKLNVKDNELEDMLKEATGPINFTMFLTLFGEKLHGTDPEETILNAFKLFDPNAKGFVHKDELQKLLMTQADKFTPEEVKQMFQSSNIDAAGNLDYKSLCYIITHGEEKEE